MELRINYSEEIESQVKKEIEYIKGEFDEMFSHKVHYNEHDKCKAMALLEYFSKTLKTSMCFDYLADTLKYLERTYSGLFN